MMDADNRGGLSTQQPAVSQSTTISQTASLHMQPGGSTIARVLQAQARKDGASTASASKQGNAERMQSVNAAAGRQLAANQVAAPPQAPDTSPTPAPRLNFGTSVAPPERALSPFAQSTSTSVGVGGHVSPKEIDRFLRGEGVPLGQHAFLVGGAGGGGGGRRRSIGEPSTALPHLSPGSTPHEQISGERHSPSPTPPNGRRKSIAEQLYGNVQAKVDSRRRSVTEKAAAPDAGDSTPERARLRKGRGHGGGVRGDASAYGFVGNYGMRYGFGDEPRGSRIWMPGNIDLPIDYGYRDPETKIEDDAAEFALASRAPGVGHFHMYDPLRSLRLRDGGGLIDILGIELSVADQAVKRAIEDKVARTNNALRRKNKHRILSAEALLKRRKELHLIVMGPAYGIDFAPAPHAEGELWADDVASKDIDDGTSFGPNGPKPLPVIRWSNAVVHAVSSRSPCKQFVSPGDPLVAVDGVSVSHMDYEHILNRLHCVAARATEASPHTLTILVASPALARAKVIMKAEMENARREEMLAAHSSAGVLGIQIDTRHVHDDRYAPDKPHSSKPRWDSALKLTHGIDHKVPTRSDQWLSDAPTGSPRWTLRQVEINNTQLLVKERKTAYTDMAGYKGVASDRFGGSASPSAYDDAMRSPVIVRASDPTIFEPVAVQINEHTVASCRAARNGYNIDIMFGSQPVGILLKGIIVQSTVAGSAADGVLLPGDVLIRVNVTDVRNAARGVGPTPTEIVSEAALHITDEKPLRLRFYRPGATLPVWVAAALGYSIDGLQDAQASPESAARTSPSENGFAMQAASVQVRALPAEVANIASRDDGPDVRAGSVLVDVTFTSKPFGMLLKGLVVAGVINGTQSAGVVEPRDEVVALGGKYVWTPEVRNHGIARMLQAAAARVDSDNPYTITFLRRVAPQPRVGTTGHDTPEPSQSSPLRDRQYTSLDDFPAEENATPGKSVASDELDIRLRELIQGDNSSFEMEEESGWQAHFDDGGSTVPGVSDGGDSLVSTDATDVSSKRVVVQFAVTFVSTPYYIKFMEGERDVKTGENTGVYVYKIKRGSQAAKYLKSGDKIIAVGSSDVSHSTLKELVDMLTSPTNVPTESKPQALTFHRLVANTEAPDQDSLHSANK